MVSYRVLDKPIPADKKEWRTGYWNDPSWRQAPLEPGKLNEKVCKYREHMSMFASSAELKLKWRRSIDKIMERDEKRFDRFKACHVKKREAMQRGIVDHCDSDMSI